MPPLSAPFSTLVGLLLVVAVVALVAWALQLMQSASDRREFSLMLAGCMVCSAAVGLATVMVLTLTAPDGLAFGPASPRRPVQESGVSLDAIVLPDSLPMPWDGQL